MVEPIGYAKVDRIKVLNACDEYLNARQNRITREREQLIKKQLERRWMRSKTREEAIEWLKAGDAISEWYLVELSGSYYADHVAALKSLAEMSDDQTVFVSAEIANTLYEFMPEKEQTT